jgi:hypothetical protein
MVMDNSDVITSTFFHSSYHLLLLLSLTIYYIT